MAHWSLIAASASWVSAIASNASPAVASIGNESEVSRHPTASAAAAKNKTVHVNSSPAKSLLQFLDRQTHGCRSTVRATPATINFFSFAKQIRNFSRCQVIPRLDRRFTRHHVENFSEGFFFA
jgi:hypothetical protein